jgi:hypothetical protein
MKTIKSLAILSFICLALSWALALGALAQQKPIRICPLDGKEDL